MAVRPYDPSNFSKKEQEMMSSFNCQRDDAVDYFVRFLKPRYDRWYKLYISYTGDRAREIQRWQSNIFVPYTHGVVETLIPRIVDARPEFDVQGRTAELQMKAEKQRQLQDYFWEMAEMDKVNEVTCRAASIFGTGFLQVSWKKDVRSYEFLKTDDLTKKLKYKKEERVFFDGPLCEHVDNYALMYDYHNVEGPLKRYWFKRLVLTRGEIERRYPIADKKRLEMAFESGKGNTTDYASVRQDVKKTHELIIRGQEYNSGVYSVDTQRYQSEASPDMKMFEVFEWWRPLDDKYAVLVNDVPIFPGGSIPNPYDFKETPFIDVPYLKVPDEFEGYGIPAILESPQIMANTIKNQRLDNATLSIHKMWIVNPLANISKRDLVTRPFGIIYSIDPGGVREVQFSDIKPSAYREEELLKSDMRYASGIDDASMGMGGGAGSATEVRHLRESTLERVRLFVNHLGDAYGKVMRYWMTMQRQFFTKEMTIRVIGESGKAIFPLIEKDDLMGEFDYRARVLPSIAGQHEVKKKQAMDLAQLLVNLPFVDPRKLFSKILPDFDIDIESIEKDQEQEMPPEGSELAPEGSEALPGGEMPPELAAMMNQGAPLPGKQIPPHVLSSALDMIRGGAEAGSTQSPFAAAALPTNLLQSGGLPPTVGGVGRSGQNPASGRVAGGGPGTSNPRGLNRKLGGKVNTNIPTRGSSDIASTLMRRVSNLQKGS